MKTTVENLLKIEGSELHTQGIVSLIFVYNDEITKIYYKFYEDAKYQSNAWVRTDMNSVIEIHFFDTIEEVINQIFYITGKRIGVNGSTI